MRISRTLKAILWSVIGVFTILAIALIVLIKYDWNHAKPWLNERVSQAIGRPFAIRGDLALSWDRPSNLSTVSAPESGWRGIVPWPHLLAHDITIGNPAWAQTTPNMIELEQVSFVLNPLALLDKKIAIHQLTLESPMVMLERTSDGRNNWTFTVDQTASGWQLTLPQLIVHKGRIHLVDDIKKANLLALVDTLSDKQTKKQAEKQTNAYGIGWTVSGTLNGQTLTGNGKAGSALMLKTQRAPFPLEAHFNMGKTAISIIGTLTKPTDLAALDLRLKISGVSMAQLYAITHVVLPETPPYMTEGHLLGTLDAHNSKWVYENFSGKVGGSDLSGTLEYQSRQPRPLLKGTVVSKVLLFQDLAPLIGADSNASKRNRGIDVVQPRNKVLPIEPFKTERWTSVDADVTFTGRKIVRNKALPIDNLTTNIHLQDGVLSLLPLNFGVSGGTLQSDIRLDGRDKIIKAEMKMETRHLSLKELFPTFKLMQTSLGEIDADAALSGTGNSIAAMLGSSNGEVKARINHGSISKLLLEEIGLNIGSVVLTKVVGDKQIAINCLASDFAVTHGAMQARSFAVDTDIAVLRVSGDISLAQEQLDLTIKSKTRDLRLFSLTAPLYVTGSFIEPQVRVDKKVLALKAGGAAVLAAVAPVFLAMAPLTNIGKNDASECSSLLLQARKKPVAPPPGKRYRATR